MKRFLLILFAGIVCLAIFFLFRPKQPKLNESVKTPTNATVALKTKNISIKTTTQAPSAIVPEPKQFLDATKAQSIADWTNTIPNLKLWNHFRNFKSWVADQGTNNPPTLLLTVNGNTIEYKAKLTSISIMNDHIQRVELQTSFMNIDETRKKGVQLCSLLGIDSTDFIAWCNKVGNNWIDAPLYSNGIHTYGFGIHRTFNNQKPWYINFVIDYQQ